MPVVAECSRVEDKGCDQKSPRSVCQWSVVQILQESQIAKELWALEKLCVFNLRPGLDRKRRGLEPTKQNCGEESPVVVLAVLTFSTVRG